MLIIVDFVLCGKNPNPGRNGGEQSWGRYEFASSPNLPFTEYDFYEEYRGAFEKTNGQDEEVLPLQVGASRRRGQGPGILQEGRWRCVPKMKTGPKRWRQGKCSTSVL